MKKKKSAGNFALLLTLLTLIVLNSGIIHYSIKDPNQLLSGTEFSTRAALDLDSFLSVWNTTYLGESDDNQVKLPLLSTGDFDFTVKWGDGSENSIIDYFDSAVTHTYSSTGVYTINITGIINGWRFNNGGDRLKILEIQQWGCLQLGNSGEAFYGCENLNLTATDRLNLSESSDLSNTFRNCYNLGINGDMNNWGVVGSSEADPERRRMVESAGARTLQVEEAGGRVSLTAALEALTREGVGTVLVEGGASVASALLGQGLVHRLHLLIAPRFLGDEGVPAFAGVPPSAAGDWVVSSRRRLGPDSMIVFESREALERLTGRNGN